MQKFISLQAFAAILSVLALTACTSGTTLDKQLLNRQVAYIDIQPGTKVDPAQALLLKSDLQPALIGALQGRGNPPPIGITVTLTRIEIPGETSTGEMIFGPTRRSANALGGVELWDATTKAKLGHFTFGVSSTVRRENMFGSVIGYGGKGYDPHTAQEIYANLSQMLAKEIANTLQGK